VRPARDLGVLRDRALRALERHRDRADIAARGFPARDAKIALALTTLDAQNAWAGFSRSYVLSTIILPRRATGGYVQTNGRAASFDDAIGLAVVRHKPYLAPWTSGRTWNRRDEPPWQDPNVLLAACGDLGCSHLNQVQLALSFSTRVFIDLPVFRNFFAHRNRGSAEAARNIAPQYSIPSYLHPQEILIRRPRGRPHSLLVDWIDDMMATVGLLCD